MELNMRVIGLKINNMVMAEKCGPMELFMKDNIKMVKKKERPNLFGVMVPLMKENLRIMLYTVIFNINSKIIINIIGKGEYIWSNGKKYNGEWK